MLPDRIKTVDQTPVPLSVLLPTYNNEAIIRDCLESVKWADELLVVDSFSTDRTLDICREYGARIIQHEYINSATQKNRAIPQCAHEWVLQMDSDEVLEEGGADEIRSVIAQAKPDGLAFRLPRKNFIFGEPIQLPSLYPDYQTRLFRRDVGRFEDKQVHAHARVPGHVGVLRCHILHHGMPTLTKQLSHFDRYTRYQADEMWRRGTRFHGWQLVLRPWAIFLYFFVWERGFTAGARGLMVAATNTAFDFWSHAKLWEMQAFGLDASPK